MLDSRRDRDYADPVAIDRRSTPYLERGSMHLTREEVEHVAVLARLGLSEEEISRMQTQLSAILEAIHALDALDTDAILPTAQVTALTNVTRSDLVSDSLARDAVLANAPRQADGFFEVLAVLGANDEASS